MHWLTGDLSSRHPLASWKNVSRANCQSSRLARIGPWDDSKSSLKCKSSLKPFFLTARRFRQMHQKHCKFFTTRRNPMLRAVSLLSLNVAPCDPGVFYSRVTFSSSFGSSFLLYQHTTPLTFPSLEVRNWESLILLIYVLPSHFRQFCPASSVASSEWM